MAGKVNVPITVAVQGLANTQKQLSALKGGIGGVGQGAAVAALSFAAFAGGIQAANLFANAIAGARDLERGVAGLKSVFESVTPQMLDFTKQAASVGLSLNEAAKASTFIGSVLKQSGFSISETADLTERLVKLGTDLSLTYGYDVQEALLGMTALFRGEYDPIEKFGVAMKQSEINAELAARGFGNLEGAARRFAEQQIRVDFLFERSADAQGAFERQSGSLAAEQLKLAATFANVRDTMAVSLLPVMGNLLEETNRILIAMGPQLQSKINMLAPKMARLVDSLIPVMEDLADATIGALDAFTDIIDFIQKNWSLLSGLAVGLGTTAVAFNILTGSIGLATGALAAFNAAVLANPVAAATAGIIGFTAAVMVATSSIDEETDPVFVDLRQRADELGSSVDRMMPGFQMLEAESQKASQYLDFLRRRVLALNKEFVNTTTIGGILKASGLTMGDLLPADDGLDTGEGAGTAARNYVKEFYDNMRDEIAKQQARIKLEGMGASEGLINSIIGGEGWEKVFSNVLQSGRRGIRELQRDFNKTAGGIKELEEERKKIAEAAQKAAEEARKELEKLQDAYQSVLDATRALKDELKEIGGIDILPTFEAEIGRFESAIIGSFERIQATLQNGFVSGAILQQDLNAITAWAKAEELALKSVAKKRDELAERYDLAEALISEYRTAFTGALQLTSIIGQLENKTREMTVTEVTEGVTNIGDSLKNLRFSLTKSYTETIEETVDKTKALVDNFKNVADRARAFADNLRKLRAMGLDPQLFNQLVQAGVEAGGETAQALVEGGSDTINEINGLFREIDDLGSSLGEEVATSLYGSGIDMADGLLAGIRSRQTEFENLARSMAETFKKTFDQAVGVATGRAEATAQLPLVQADLTAAQAEQQRITQRIAEETALLTGGQAGPKAREWAVKKIESYTNQLTAIGKTIADATTAVTNANTAINAPLSLPMTPMVPVGAQSAGVVNNYTVNVTADSRLSGAKAGEAVVQQLVSYQNANGSITAVLGSK